MKHISIFLLLTLIACSGKEARIKSALADHHDAKVTVLSFSQASENVADSLMLAALRKRHAEMSDEAIKLISIGAVLSAAPLKDSLLAIQKEFEAIQSRMHENPKGGYVLCRYVVDISNETEKRMDTLTAAIAPDFTVLVSN